MGRSCPAWHSTTLPSAKHQLPPNKATWVSGGVQNKQEPPQGNKAGLSPARLWPRATPAQVVTDGVGSSRPGAAPAPEPRSAASPRTVGHSPKPPCSRTRNTTRKHKQNHFPAKHKGDAKCSHDSPKRPRNTTGTRSHKHGLFSSSSTAARPSFPSPGAFLCAWPRQAPPAHGTAAPARSPDLSSRAGVPRCSPCPRRAPRPTHPPVSLRRGRAPHPGPTSPRPELSLSAAQLLPCADKTPPECRSRGSKLSLEQEPPAHGGTGLSGCLVPAPLPRGTAGARPGRPRSAPPAEPNRGVPAAAAGTPALLPRAAKPRSGGKPCP